MGVLDKFLDAIKLNDEDDDYLDDDILDDDDDFLDDEVPEKKPRRGFFEKFGSKKSASKADDDYDDYDDDDGLDEFDYDDDDEDLEPEPEPVTRRSSVAVSSDRSKTSSSVRPKAPAPVRTSAASRTSTSRPSTSRTSTSRPSVSARDDRLSRQSSSSKITPMRRNKSSGGQTMEVCVLRPLSMENTREIADMLIDESTVILNLEGIDVELAQRIIDFASGACYSLGGTLQKVSSYIFVLGPENVDITGDMPNLLGGSAPSISAGY